MKHVLVTIAGLIVASLVTFLIEKIGHSVFPMPSEINPMDVESIKQNIHLIPKGSMAFVVAAHGIGTLAGMFIAGLISKTSLIPAYIVGGFMIVATIANLIRIPSPTWFVIADVLSVAIGFFIGKQLAQSKLK